MGESEAQLARRRARRGERRATDPEYREQRNAECRDYYARNREAQRARTAAWRAANPELERSSRRTSYARYAAWMRSLKIGKSCVDCGFGCTDDTYWAFDWDHRPGVVKLFTVSQAPRQRLSQDEVLAEVAKCDLRCRNCHAIITHQRRKASVSKDDKDWAGKGFGKRNEESAPEPKPDPKDDDDESWVWE